MTTSWIEKSMHPGCSQLVADGELVARFPSINLPDEMFHEALCSIIDSAITYGENKKAKEIKKALNIK